MPTTDADDSGRPAHPVLRNTEEAPRWRQLGAVVSVAAFVLIIHAFGAALVGDLPLLLARVAVLALVPLAAPLATRRSKHWSVAVGLAGLAFIHVLIGVTGGLPDSPLYPMIYAWIAAGAALSTPLGAVVTALAAVLVDVIATSAAGVQPVVVLLAHIALMAVFAALFAVLLRGEVEALRRASKAGLEDALDRVEQDAHDFRLTAPVRASAPTLMPEPGEVAPTHKRWVGSVRAIREAMDDVLELARICVDADSVMLFTSTSDGLKLKACAPASCEPSSIDRPIPATEGALGAVVRTTSAVRLTPKDAGKRLGHPAQRDARSFLGVPLIDDGVLRGVLAAHRLEPRAFETGDEARLAALGREVLRTVESERIFAMMDRASHEQERFYDAFELLNAALSVDGVAERLLDSVSRIRTLDFGAVTLFDAEAKEHTIVRVRDDRAKLVRQLEGTTYPNKAGGLVAMAVKNRRPLPYVPLSQQPDRVGQQVFGEGLQVDLRSVKVFPMADREAPLGALVVGSQEDGRELAPSEERMIETVVAHAAITMANARMYKEMERMATTDGLTGLVNRRRFNELLSEALARAERFGRQVAVLMVDADHFKRVNDNHGHPVGDLVLKRIAKLLVQEARRTDVVARYGGEEFVVILDETDADGAVLVAERMREAIASERIHGDFGKLSVTASMGLAVWPQHAKSQGDLLEAADQALYVAKQDGRNRVEVFARVRCIPPDDPDIAAPKERART